jgi:hypothetical protein
MTACVRILGITLTAVWSCGYIMSTPANWWKACLVLTIIIAAFTAVAVVVLREQ